MKTYLNFCLIKSLFCRFLTILLIIKTLYERIVLRMLIKPNYLHCNHNLYDSILMKRIYLVFILIEIMFIVFIQPMTSHLLQIYQSSIMTSSPKCPSLFQLSRSQVRLLTWRTVLKRMLMPRPKPENGLKCVQETM